MRALSYPLKDCKARRRGIVTLTHVDLTITDFTTQPTVHGPACKNCGSTVKFKKKKGVCVRCHKQWRRDHEKRPKYYYSKASKNVLKISPEEYFLALENQDWACLICKEIPKRLYVDHCHETGRFRGLLCLKCNSGLGMFQDSPARLQTAIEYLAK